MRGYHGASREIPLRFEADDRIKRRRRFREAVDHAHGPASVGHRADRGAVSIVYDGTSNHRDLDGELRSGVAVCARRSRRDRIGLSPGAQQGADPSRSFREADAGFSFRKPDETKGA